MKVCCNYRYLVGCIFFFTMGSVAAPLEVGITHFPPLFFVDKNGSPSGHMVDVLKDTLDQVGAPYYVASYPPKRLFRNLTTGISQVAIGIKTNSPEGMANVLYSSRAVYRIELRITHLTSTPSPETFEGILGSSVGLIRGYQYGHRREMLERDNGTRTINLTSHASGLEMLAKGRISYLLDYKEPIDTVLTEKQIQTMNHLTIQELDMFFIVSKKTPQADDLMMTLEEIYFQ